MGAPAIFEKILHFTAVEAWILSSRSRSHTGRDEATGRRCFKPDQTRQLRDNVPPLVKAKIDALCQHGVGEVVIVGGVGTVLIELRIKAPGLSSSFLTNQ